MWGVCTARASRSASDDMTCRLFAEDGAVGPIDIVPIELYGPVVFLLGVGEEAAIDVFTGGDFQDGLGADALVDVERYGVDGEGFLLALAGPFEPWFVDAQGCGEDLGFVGG
jgi:hypothetical protein